MNGIFPDSRLETVGDTCELVKYQVLAVTNTIHPQPLSGSPPGNIIKHTGVWLEQFDISGNNFQFHKATQAFTPHGQSVCPGQPVSHKIFHFSLPASLPLCNYLLKQKSEICICLVSAHSVNCIQLKNFSASDNRIIGNNWEM